MCPSSENGPKHGVVIFGTRIGHFTLCASKNDDGSCAESLSVSEALVASPSPYDDVSCDYRGEALSVLHQGDDLYEATLRGSDGETEVVNFLICRRTYSCR
jgi:hypothetical protein